MCYLFSLLLSYDRYFFILAVKISQNRLKEDKLAVGDGQISSIANTKTQSGFHLEVPNELNQVHLPIYMDTYEQ